LPQFPALQSVRSGTSQITERREDIMMPASIHGFDFGDIMKAITPTAKLVGAFLLIVVAGILFGSFSR
jgi:hypothetical protein